MRHGSSRRGSRQQVIRDRVTFVSCVPSYLDLVLRQAPDALRLEHLALGGEAFTVAFAQHSAAP